MTTKEELDVLLAAGVETGAVVEIDNAAYIRGKIASALEASNSYNPEIADKGRDDVAYWQLLLSVVENPGGVNVAELEKEILSKVKKSLKADFDALEARIATLEKLEGLDALEKRLAALEKPATK